VAEIRGREQFFTAPGFFYGDEGHDGSSMGFFLPCSGPIIAHRKLKHSGTALDTPELYNQFISLIDSRHPPVGVRVGPP